MTFAYFLELWVEFGVLPLTLVRNMLEFGALRRFWSLDSDLGIDWRLILQR